jgi:hypothetical protein
MDRSRSLSILALCFAVGCDREIVAPANRPASSDSPSLETVSATSTPQFLRPAADAPRIANPLVKFYAKKGVDREAFMYYHRSTTGKDSVVFLRMRVRARSLARRPNGSRIAFGDSVLITIRLVDPTRLIVDCQPAGLKFSTEHPADLKLSYAETDPDVNRDGRVDTRDRQLTSRFKIWRRETNISPWTALPSTVTFGTHEVETDIFGFTRYAIAF